MELVACFILAGILGAGRSTVDGIHAAKGSTPPRVERARLRAEKTAAKHRGGVKQPWARRGPARAYWSGLWADAWSDAHTHRSRVRAEKLAGDRPTLGERTRRLGQLLWQPVGEKPATAVEPQPAAVGDEWTSRFGPHTTPVVAPRQPEGPRRPVEPEAAPVAADITEPETTTSDTTTSDTNPDHEPEGEPAMTAPTGEALNYETTISELEAIRAVQQDHVDQATAALAALADAKTAINNVQVSYTPAAEAAASVNEHLAALNLDGETLAHTGTVADAMPPNAVDTMFDQIEAMESAAQQQLTNAETALASTEAALATVQAKYGDAHSTVAGELSGDSRFLASAA